MPKFIRKSDEVDAWQVGNGDLPQWLATAALGGRYWTVGRQLWLLSAGHKQKVGGNDWIVREVGGNLKAYNPREFAKGFEEVADVAGNG